MTSILVHPQELRQVAEQLNVGAKKVGFALQAIDININSLKGNSFLGNRAEALQRHYAPMRDALLKATKVVAPFVEDLQSVAKRFEQANNNHGTERISPTGNGDIFSVEPNASYTTPDYLTMVDNGGFCAVVAYFRNLYMQGVAFSKDDFDKAMKYYKDVYPNGRVPISEIVNYLSKYGAKDKDFMWWDSAQDWFKDWQNDKEGAEKFIIDQFKSGNLVMIDYLTDADADKSNHAGNIVGINTDSNGKIKSVILDNSSELENDRIQTIGWDSFVKQWMRAGGEALVLVDGSAG